MRKLKRKNKKNSKVEKILISIISVLIVILIGLIALNINKGRTSEVSVNQNQKEDNNEIKSNINEEKSRGRNVRRRGFIGCCLPFEGTGIRRDRGHHADLAGRGFLYG